MGRGSFRPYLAVFSAQFRMLLQYRAAAIAGLGTQVFWGFIRVMIFDAFYRSSTAAQPMTLSQVVTYVWLGQATLGFILFGTDPQIRAMIRDGTVAYELVRPVGLYGLWFSRCLAGRVTPTLMRAIPMLALGLTLFGAGLPASWPHAAMWVASTAMAALLSGAIMVLISVSLFWTVSGEGVARLVPVLVWIMSGIIVPLPLYPDWAQAVLNALPFRGLIDTPFRIYMGQVPMDQAWGMLAHQATWIACLIVAGRWLLARGARAVVVQGG